MRKNREVEDEQTGYKMKYVLSSDGQIMPVGVSCPYERYQEPSPEVKARLMALAHEEAKDERERIHRKLVDAKHDASTGWMNR